MKSLLILDYETRSKAELKKCGVFEYAKDPSTEILCAAWKTIFFGQDGKPEPQPTMGFTKHRHRDGLEQLQHVLTTRDVIVAHNAGFEQAITTHVLGLYIPPEKWECTAARAAALALPRSLEGAADALGLPVKKDKMGKLLIQRHCKPRRPSKNNPSEWNDDAEGLDALFEYCKRDVDVEWALLRATRPLTPFEKKIWCLDQKINQRGVRVDRELVGAALDLLDIETLKTAARVSDLTGGVIESATKRDQILGLLKVDGLELPNLQAKTVDDALKSGSLTSFQAEILGLRKASSKTSTAKFEAFERRSRVDGRVRDNLMYHGASTGRWSGSGVQVHNFPRGTLKDPVPAVQLIKDKRTDLIGFVYGSVSQTLSNVLRSVLIATEGNTMYCGDYASIEVRVLFWIAENALGLELYNQKRDAYREMASVIFGVTLESVTKDQREIGKRVILGAGYGMGYKKFVETCATFGVVVSEDLAKHAIQTYRTLHKAVPKLWANLERAAIAAVQNPGKRFRINKTIWEMRGRFLFCELPSGRSLAYADPTVRQGATPWGEPKATLYHFGSNPISKNWENCATYGGRLCENVVQAVARDFMAGAMDRLESNGYAVLISVHDELLTERPKGSGSVEEFKKLMAERPAWGVGCPIEVDAWSGERYRK